MLVCVYIANQMPPSVFEFVTLMVAMLLHQCLSSFFKKIKK